MMMMMKCIVKIGYRHNKVVSLSSVCDAKVYCSDMHGNGISIPTEFPGKFDGNGNTNVQKMGTGMRRVYVRK